MSDQEETQGFDYRTVIRDPKTGKVIRTQDYILRCSADGDVLTRDGKKVYANGKPYVEPLKATIANNLEHKAENKPDLSVQKK